jgi:DsbC/DsbD-like thiol-disulfide interchange protein
VTGARLVVAAAALLQAQTPKPPVVTIGESSPVAIAPGGRAQAHFSVTIAPGFHVQANPASQPNLIPLHLELRAQPPLRLGVPAYPHGKRHRLQGSDLDFSVYDGTIEVGVPLQAAKDAAPLETTIEGSLRYQACNDRLCLGPQDVPVRLAVRITAPGH